MSAVLIILSLFFASAFGSGIQNRMTPPPVTKYFVSMQRAEILKIIGCVSDSGQPTLCEDYNVCLSMLPPPVLANYKICREAINGVSWAQCYGPPPVYNGPEGRAQIVDCIDVKTRRLTPIEDITMVQVELCFRAVGRRCNERTGNSGAYRS